MTNGLYITLTIYPVALICVPPQSGLPEVAHLTLWGSIPGVF